MGGAVSAGEDNDELIDNLVEAEYIKTPAIERVFRAVDRADYYVEGCKENAYRDLAWKHGNLHLSAPCIYSEVMESLKLGPGMSFLNLGSGTGYLSTMAGLVLGTYGTNHGVELHSDVVSYAKTKLEEFQATSSALDKYEFCAPDFIAGNCLLLDCSMHQYDRVYCGASCPAEHENYMKNLIRVGGILVMPLNDHLLQITRTSETSWDIKNILPVSFASLVLPSPKEIHNPIKLPETHPLSLQEICRSTIRVILRANVDFENPTLKDRKKRHPRRKKAKRRVRRIVIPIFEESDDGHRSNQGDVNDNYPADSPQPSEEDKKSDSEAANNQEPTVADDYNKQGGDSLEEADIAEAAVQMEVNVDENIEESPLPEKRENNRKKRAVFDIFTSKNVRHKMKHPNGDNGLSSNNSDDSFLDEYISDSEMADAGSDDPSCSHSKDVRGNDSTDRKRSAEDDDDDDTSDPRTSHRSDRIYTTRRTTAVIFKRVAFSDLDSDGDSDSEKDGIQVKISKDSKEKDTHDYTYYMKQKINELPLPHTLKYYVNYYRPV